MNVAVVRLPDGRTRTIKLSDIRMSQPRAAALPANIPEMGRNMTANAPAVRKVQAQAKPVPGQVPEVKVKQEPQQVQAALAQPPAPVSAQEAGRIGQPDPQSGRQILQPSDSLVQNERLAADSAPYLTTKLSEAAASVPGASFDRLRPQKGLQRLQEKVADGKPPSTIGDNLAAQIVANTVAAKDQLIARLRQQFPIISIDDKFLEPREKAGYPSTNVQVQMPNGSTAEVQIVTPEIQAITDQTHRLYTLGRNFPEGSADRAWYWNQAEAMHRAALEKFLARNGQPSATSFVPGEKVVLRNGHIGKVLGPSRDRKRIVVRTRRGMQTVKLRDVRQKIANAYGTGDFRFPTGRTIMGSSRLGGRVGSQKVQSLLNAYIPLEPDAVLNVAAQVRSSVEKGNQKLPDIVWVNHPVMHLIWHWRFTNGLRVTGISADADGAKELAGIFDVLAEQLKATHNASKAWAVSRVSRHIREAIAKDTGAALVMRTGDAHYDLVTAREERGHLIQERIGLGNVHKHANLAKLWLEPEFKKASDALVREGYPNNPPIVVMEAAIKLLVGQGELLSLSEAEQVSAIRKYLRSIRDQAGPSAADDLILVSEPKYHTIFDEVKNEARF